MGLGTDDLTLARGYLSDTGSSAVQSILIQNATGGTFTITFSGQTTAALAYNASAADVQNALAALSNMGVGNVVVNNTAPYVVYFIGTLGGAAQPMLTVNSAGLSGTGVTTTVTAIANGGQFAFSNADLDLLYSQANTNFFLMIAYAYRWLLADFARLNDYVAGQTRESKNQIFLHLKEMQDLFQQWANADRQVQTSRLQQVPPRIRAFPFNTGVPATSLSTRPPRLWGPWGKNW